MSRLHVVPIVEGDGEFHCVRILVDRVWRELVGGTFVNVLQPIRQPRTRLVRPEGLQRAVKLALSKLAQLPDQDGGPALVLILIDADDDCPADLAPRLLEMAGEVAPRERVACVLACVEYETWFVAAAESLSTDLNLDPNEPVPNDPEDCRLRKKWIEDRFRKSRYSETRDQPALTARMDLKLCRRRSPSFDKLCRVLKSTLNS